MNAWLFVLACQPIEEDDSILDPLEFYKELQDTSSESTNPIEDDYIDETNYNTRRRRDNNISSTP